MHFDKEYNIDLKDMIKTIIRNLSRRCLPGFHDNLALDFVSDGNYVYYAHSVNTYLPNL